MRTKKRLREVLCQGGGARHDQSLRESLLSRDAAGLVSLKEAASNLRANLEIWIPNPPYGQAKERKEEEEKEELRRGRAEKKEKRRHQLLCQRAFLSFHQPEQT